jgi:hypothetical protein
MESTSTKKEQLLLLICNASDLSVTFYKSLSRLTVLKSTYLICAFKFSMKQSILLHESSNQTDGNLIYY